MAIDFVPEEEEKDKGVSFTPEDEVTTELESEGVEPTPETDISGMTGAVGRGVVKGGLPVAAGAGLGFVLGGPVGAGIGAVGLPIATALGDLTVEGVNAYFGTDYGTVGGALTKLLDSIGAPKPDTSAERITEAVVEGLTSGGAGFFAKGGAKAGAKILEEGGKMGLLSKIAPETLQKVQKTTKVLGERPVEQMIVSGAASGLASGTQEAGYGPAASILAGLGTPLAYSALKRVPDLARSTVRTFRPTEVMKQQEAEQRLSGLYQHLFNQRPEQREKALINLRNAGQINDEEVKLLSGELSGDPGLLAVQKMAEKTSLELADRKMQNMQAISNKIDNSLLQSGASPEEVASFFQAKKDQLQQISDEAIEGLDMAAQEAYSIEISKANEKLAKQQKLLESGVITAQEANDNIEKEIEAVGDFVRQKANINKKNASSVGASNVILKQKEAASNQADILFGKIKGVSPFQQPKTKTIIDKIISETPEGKGGRKDIHPIIQDIYANVSDESGSLKLKELWEPLKWRQKLNDEIGKSMRSGNQVVARDLERVKEGIDADIEKLGEVYPQIKEANKFYAEYKDIYHTGAAEKAFERGADPAKALDEYIASPKKTTPQELQRLRRAIAGHPGVSLTEEAENLKKSGLRNVDEWIHAQASDAMGKKPTSQALISWKNKNGDQIFKAFEGSGIESESQINNIIEKLQNLEKMYDDAKEGLKQASAKAKSEGQNAIQVNKESERIANELIKQKDRAANKIRQNFIEQTDPKYNPANKFIGANAQELVGQIMNDKIYGEQQIKTILSKASEDPSGKAIEGIKNAAKQYLNSQIRSSSKELVQVGFDDPVLRIKNLQADLNSADNLLKEGTTQRKVIELIFGKNSKELNALDKARQQLSVMTRQPEVAIKEFSKLEETQKEKIIDNLMSIGGVAFGGLKGWVAWKGIDLIRKFQKQTKQDVGSIFSKLLVESLYDPQKAIALTEPITTESFPMVQKVLKNAGISVKASDFGLQDEDNKVKENESGFKEE